MGASPSRGGAARARRPRRSWQITRVLATVVRAIAPECRTQVVGIRPGEKLHEVMVTEDDARRTLEFDAHYVIQPDFPWWEERAGSGGKPVPARFRYSSDTNPRFLTPQELLKLVEMP